MKKKSTTQYILGIDLGTSGIRACIVARGINCSKNKHCNQPVNFREEKLSNLCNDRVVYQTAITFTNETLEPANTFDAQRKDEIAAWYHALVSLLTRCKKNFPLHKVNQIIGDATSSTVYLANAIGKPISPVLMYHNQQATDEAQMIERCSTNDRQTAVTGASSSLAKILYLYKKIANKKPSQIKIVHQIDWLNDFFTQCLASNHNYYSDENNLLKLGYNPKTKQYPDWVIELVRRHTPEITLPKAQPAGEIMTTVSEIMQKKFNFAKECQVCFGTTDSIAGFLASGASAIGDSVTSLGSTIAIKQLIQKPIFSQEQGLYSHKIKDFWLLGGASNGGGKTLLTFYSLNEIEFLDRFCQQAHYHFNSNNQSNAIVDNIMACPLYSELITAFTKLGRYYSLCTTGERFPINDATFTGRLAMLPQKTLAKTFNLLDQNAYQEIDFEGVIESAFRQTPDSKAYELCQHLLFFSSIIQGLIQIEKQAYELMNQLYPTEGKLYSVGGGNKNHYWQILRQKYLPKAIESPKSEDASYGVTRLVKTQLNN